ncbi:MAG: Xaa-Pro peptidase family protein [Syntrophomonas sp.]|nr:Xaa-Pro peptidase family protein [Syntrophomonas sp.]
MRQFMKENRLDVFMVTKPENIRYLSAFSGGSDAKLVISSDGQYILTDSRYIEQAKRECPDWELMQEHVGRLDSLASICDKYNRLAVESHCLSYDQFQQYANRLKSELVPLANTIERHRVVKDELELDLLRTSARIGDSVFSQICLEIQEGVSEKHIANRITYLLKEGGSSRESFDTIAVAGENAALPHGQPGNRLLSRGDMLTLDFGGFYQGYAGDMTRTVMIGEASPKLRDIYQQVLEAQELGVSLINAGVSCREIDVQVREVLRKYGLDIYFQHGTGHGVGLEIHEIPRLSPLSDDILQEGMVVTVEPGVYIPGWGGVRIEDTVIVKKGGCEIITHSDKRLLII